MSYNLADESTPKKKGYQHDLKKKPPATAKVSRKKPTQPKPAQVQSDSGSSTSSSESEGEGEGPKKKQKKQQTKKRDPTKASKKYKAGCVDEGCADGLTTDESIERLKGVYRLGQYIKKSDKDRGLLYNTLSSKDIIHSTDTLLSAIKKKERNLHSLFSTNTAKAFKTQGSHIKKYLSLKTKADKRRHLLDHPGVIDAVSRFAQSLHSDNEDEDGEEEGEEAEGSWDS